MDAAGVPGWLRFLINLCIYGIIFDTIGILGSGFGTLIRTVIGF